jgi:hypothetical protein
VAIGHRLPSSVTANVGIPPSRRNVACGTANNTIRCPADGREDSARFGVRLYERVADLSRQNDVHIRRSVAHRSDTVAMQIGH